MILVDSSVWIDYLRSGDVALARLLEEISVLTHPFILGELALGNLRQREQILDDLQTLPEIIPATDDEVMHFINTNHLYGKGIGYVDAHLLASVRLTPGSRIWTRDKRFDALAREMNIAHSQT
ncbi:MAG: PIN domain-containing protein [Oceanibaculum nanhaiense]|uniref:type II toxin-antitoxin system VapC family toxin n=1 Tax=Oceanibaculum nanhaiense TaxID=1909734 RepID=UPI0025A3193A|nr:PIN domain-containing protein [Oceanibaculum nanhaiense]MDM7947001.1 PIN domain-containing protein [Oceanibaculum nanhaiense]